MNELDQKTLETCEAIASELIANFDAKRSNVVKLTLLAAINLDLQLVIMARVLKRDRRDVFDELASIIRA